MKKISELCSIIKGQELKILRHNVMLGIKENATGQVMSFLIRVEDVKADAIADIKELQKFDTSKKFDVLTNKSIQYSELGKQAIINYLKFKHNLKESEIKSRRI
ncbi:MAG TPA: hypothetical protein VMV95_03655 [Bacillota bacterium]|nr:hypothetical protein [Bacillota bacterium]